MNASSNKTEAERLASLENNMEMIKISIIGITGVLVMAGVVGIIRGRNVARFHHISANRISLVRPSGKISLPDRIMADLYLNSAGRPVISVHGGSVLMNTSDRQPLLRIDSDLSPELVEAFSLETTNGGEHLAQEAMQLNDLTGSPAITMFSKDYSTVSIMSPKGKVLMSGRISWNHIQESNSDDDAQNPDAGAESQMH